MFAKLYETEDFGQILVKNDTGDEGPEIRFYFRPMVPDGLGVCSVAIQFKDTDAGFDQADKAFDAIDEAAACRAVGAVQDQLREATQTG